MVLGVTANTTAMTSGRRRAVRLAAALIPALLLLTACTSEKPSQTQTPSPTADAWVSTYKTPAPTELAPLRGTVVPAGSLTHPSLSVKIDNHEAARPQIGLERADIVFEELVEGGLTRYVGIWQSDIPDLLGPVRSIRPMDPDIISPFGGIVAYSGGQQMFVDMMKATPVVNAVFDYDRTGLFYRIGTRPAPHNVIVRASSPTPRASRRRLRLSRANRPASSTRGSPPPAGQAGPGMPRGTPTCARRKAIRTGAARARS
jgi:hypothetical protein